MNFSVSIKELHDIGEALQIRLDGSFIVDSLLCPEVSGGQFSYTIREIPGYLKRYADPEEQEYADYLGHPDRVIFLAMADGNTIGQIAVKSNWNQYAFVDFLTVDKDYRGYGAGRKLMDQAKHWALAQGMPGLMLETQNVNVRACRFYESCGFVLGGVDFYLYRGLSMPADEVALYWYLHFNNLL